MLDSRRRSQLDLPFSEIDRCKQKTSSSIVFESPIVFVVFDVVDDDIGEESNAIVASSAKLFVLDAVVVVIVNFAVDDSLEMMQLLGASTEHSSAEETPSTASVGSKHRERRLQIEMTLAECCVEVIRIKTKRKEARMQQEGKE